MRGLHYHVRPSNGTAAPQVKTVSASASAGRRRQIEFPFIQPQHRATAPNISLDSRMTLL
jgi:hypothetical protein